MAVLNAVPVCTFLLPLTGSVEGGPNTIRTMQVNVNTQHGNPEKVIAAIQHESPDIVMLEEINDQWLNELSPIVDQYPVRIIETRPDNFGIGILSRIAMTTTQVVYWGTAEVPSIIATTSNMTIIATHPLPPGGPAYSAYRNEQLEKIAHVARSIKGELVLMGDLNITPWSTHYRHFIEVSRLKNSSEGRGIFPSWPVFAPLMLIPIDHFLHTGGIRVTAKRVGPNVGSDHYPVVVDFEIER